MNKIINRKFLLLLLLVFVIGITAMWWVAYSTDKNMRQELLIHARITANAINIEHIDSLSGSESDLGTPAYERIKSQLESMRNAVSKCRFLYLMGRRSDGVVFFYVDSLPVDSKDYAPPGLVYKEVSDSYLHYFNTKQEAVAGPVTDRWGKLVTALIPLTDPHTNNLVAVLGMDVDAKDWYKEIIGRCFIPFTVMLLFAVSIILFASRKQAAKALKENEKKHRLFFENAPIGIIHYDKQGIISAVNEEMIAILGSTREKLIGLNMLDLPNETMTNEIRKSLNGVRGYYEGQYTSFTGGKILNIIASWIPIFRAGSFIHGSGIIEDITKRKKTEETLARRMELERLISKISSEFVGLSSDEIDAGINLALASVGAFSGADRAYVFLFQKSGNLVDNSHEWCANGIQPQIDDLKDIPLALELPWFTEQIQKHEVFYVPNVKYLPPEALVEQKHFEDQGIKSLIVLPMKLSNHLLGFIGFDAVHEYQTWDYDNQAILRFIGEIFINDIERKRTDKEQENLQVKLANALEMAHLASWEYDAINDLFTFNDYFYKIFHTTADQAGGYTMSLAEYFRRFVHHDDISYLEEESRKAIEANASQYKLEHRIFYADGTIGYISVLCSVIRDANGQILKTYGVNQDITERKKAEDRLRESEEKLARSKKMESLGLLAGGVAHDLNNVLSGIVSYPELLLLDLPEDSKLRKPIETIQESGNKAVSIVQELLTIARGVASPKEPLNLNNIVKEYLHSPEYNKLKQFHQAIEIKTDLDQDLVNIAGSLIHIRKLIMNLIANAAEAIEDSGTVIISTRNCYVDRPIRGYEDVNTGEYVILSVADDGPGILVEHLERIFEPFFTKKIMGKSGTGLGLAVVWNVMQDHKGYINVTSNGSGTIFDLYFPITRDKTFKKDKPLLIKEYKGNHETIMVIDDVESQREITCNILKTLGYDSFAVPGGEEAIEYLKEHAVDLIILDMIMEPGLSGRETYERIIKIYPKQKAIIVSGFSETNEVKETQDLGAGQYLKKPLTLEKIGLAIKLELEKQ
ncbi:MAG: PAS domain S-box protein [Proteobacteria bacterium]|nr:PAS domain S-box protein [Pseudomonadota bacterium]